MITFNFQIIDSHIRSLDLPGYAILSFSCIFGGISIKLICHGIPKNHLPFRSDLSHDWLHLQESLAGEKNTAGIVG